MAKGALIVCGAPRTGTSMMMQTLDLLGFPVAPSKFCAGNSEFKQYNPLGYYEFPDGTNRGGLPEGKYDGKALKVSAQALQKTPPERVWKAILCVRNLEEAVESRVTMGKGVPALSSLINPDNAKQNYCLKTMMYSNWLKEHKPDDHFIAQYNFIIEKPALFIVSLMHFIYGADAGTLAGNILEAYKNVSRSKVAAARKLLTEENGDADDQKGKEDHGVHEEGIRPEERRESLLRFKEQGDDQGCREGRNAEACET